MSKPSFRCVDAHTCGNPVRVVIEGAPPLSGPTMSDRRRHFMEEYDWIRTGLMFEPRGHDVMSGTILYEPTTADADAGLIFIETTGCLPMCGHGTIGTITVLLEEGLVVPRQEGRIRLDVPAGIVDAEYQKDESGRIVQVRIRNVASYLSDTGLRVDVNGLGPIGFDVAYGGNFYAIIEPQPGYAGLEAFSAFDIQQFSPLIRQVIAEHHEFVHPEDPTITGLRHIMWTSPPRHPDADARNAVFYGEKAIDRSPCGTGTSARMAQLAARGALRAGDDFVHESIIGSLFHGRVEATARVGDHPAIIPSIAGQAWVTGHNTIHLDEHDPFVRGFTVR